MAYAYGEAVGGLLSDWVRRTIGRNPRVDGCLREGFWRKGATLEVVSSLELMAGTLAAVKG